MRYMIGWADDGSITADIARRMRPQATRRDAERMIAGMAEALDCRVDALAVYAVRAGNGRSKGMEMKATKAKVREVALEFSRVLHRWLTHKQMAEVIRRNRTPEYTDACASHDFCDANMAMAEAMEAHGFDPMRNNKVWNAAWALAKASDFEVTR